MATSVGLCRTPYYLNVQYPHPGLTSGLQKVHNTSHSICNVTMSPRVNVIFVDFKHETV